MPSTFGPWAQSLLSNQTGYCLTIIGTCAVRLHLVTEHDIIRVCERGHITRDFLWMLVMLPTSNVMIKSKIGWFLSYVVIDNR